jgi:hypothetical protein
MDLHETLFRLGLSLAIGLLVGVERHWREREAQPGSRTAGLRTFGLTGLLGGIAGLMALTSPFGGGLPGALLIGSIYLGLASALIIFKLREAIEDETTSVTTVVAALVVFALGPAIDEPTIEALQPRAVHWQARLALPFRRWVRDLRAVPHSSELRRIPPTKRALPPAPRTPRAAAGRRQR